MENEVKKEGQESIEDTIITTAPVVDDVIAEEAPKVEAMPAIEPIPAAPVETPAVEPVSEVVPPVETVVEPVVEAVPAVEQPTEPVTAPVAEVTPAVAPVEEVKAEPVAEAVKPVEEPAPAPAPVQSVQEEAPKDEVKGVEVNPNVVTEAKPAEPVQNNVEQAPAVDLNGGNFKEASEQKSNANSWPKIIAAFIILALLIFVGFNIDKIRGLFTNLDNNTGNAEEVEPTPTPDVVDEETKLTCSKSSTDELGTVTLETYTYNGTNKLLKNYTLVTSVSNPTVADVLTQSQADCELAKASYLGEAGYILTCELIEGKNAVKTLTVDNATYKLYADTHAEDGMGAPAEETEVDPATIPVVPVRVPAPEFDLDANMDDIKNQKVALGYTCE